MAPEREDQFTSLITVLFDMRLVTNVEVVASSMFIWDYVLTFRMEVDLVWQTKWNFMKGLYLFQRYLPLIDTVGLIFYRQTGANLTEATCWRLCFATGVFVVIGLSASEMILTLRTWAVWNRNKRLSIIFPILFNGLWIPGLVILLRFSKSVTFGPPPYPGFKGCFMTYANHDIVFLWAILLIWDALLLMLMLVPAIRAYRDGGNSTLVKAVYRDGIIYYSYLFVVSCTNIIIVETNPEQYSLLLSPVVRMLHSMLTSRVLLQIRAHAGDNAAWSDGVTELSMLTFHDARVISPG